MLLIILCIPLTDVLRIPLSDVLDNLTMAAIFDRDGEIPLPPYMRRTASPADVVSYQTVYASPTSCGSVAAPTAGLHFTDEILRNLHDRGVTSSKIELHVSAGTFRPVTVALIGEHLMHKERFEASIAAVQEIIINIGET